MAIGLRTGVRVPREDLRVTVDEITSLAGARRQSIARATELRRERAFPKGCPSCTRVGLKGSAATRKPSPVRAYSLDSSHLLQGLDEAKIIRRRQCIVQCAKSHPSVLSARRAVTLPKSIVWWLRVQRVVICRFPSSHHQILALAVSHHTHHLFA